jgi:hypothetical protein
LASATNLGADLIAAAGTVGLPDRDLLAQAAKSRWVNEEILTFKRLGKRAPRFLPGRRWRAWRVRGSPARRISSASRTR